MPTFDYKIFAEAPKTRKALDLKQEMMQNAMDKYDDILDGKLNEYLHKIGKECHERIDQFVEQMKAGQQLQKLLRILITKIFSH